MHLICMGRGWRWGGLQLHPRQSSAHGERAEGCLEPPGPRQGTESTRMSTEGSPRAVVNWASGEPRSQDVNTRYHGGNNGRKLLPPRRGRQREEAAGLRAAELGGHRPQGPLGLGTGSAVELLLRMLGKLQAAAAAGHGTEGPAGSAIRPVTVTATGNRQEDAAPPHPPQCSCSQSLEGSRWQSLPPSPPPPPGSEASGPGAEPWALGSARAAVGTPAIFLQRGSGPSVLSPYHPASPN